MIPDAMLIKPEERNKELVTLRRENERLRQRERELLGYLRTKIDNLLKVMGTDPLHVEELDDEHMIAFDPIGIITDTFAHILDNLRSTNAQLALTRDEIAAIFNTAGAGILVLDQDQRIISCNRRLREMFKSPAYPLTGKRCLEVLCHREVSPGDCVFFKVLASGQIEQTLNWQFSERYFDVVAAPMKDLGGAVQQVVMVYQEVTARRRIEAELQGMVEEIRAAHSQIDSIIHSVTEGLLVTAADNTVALANPAAAEIFATTPAALLGRSLTDLFPEEAVAHRFAQATVTGTIPHPFDLQLPGSAPGDPRVFQVRTALLRDGGERRRGLVLTLHDVTRERSLERMKSEFVSTAAHELRTPLAAILGFSELLLNPDMFTVKEQADFIQLIHRKAEDLSAVIEDVLDISRIESGGKVPLELHSCLLAPLLDQSVELFRHAGTAHRFEILLPQEPVRVRADAIRFSQILDNLLSNAVKYSPDGGLIRIAIEVTPLDCVISITDEGIGMTAEQVERIFDKFYRANASDTAISGTGLGMTIVKELVEAHEGAITVTSMAGRGTTVTFTLPLTDNAGVP